MSQIKVPRVSHHPKSLNRKNLNFSGNNFKIQFKKYDTLILELTEEIRKINVKLTKNVEIGKDIHRRMDDDVARLQIRVSDLEKNIINRIEKELEQNCPGNVCTPECNDRKEFSKNLGYGELK